MDLLRKAILTLALRIPFDQFPFFPLDLSAHTGHFWMMSTLLGFRSTFFLGLFFTQAL